MIGHRPACPAWRGPVQLARFLPGFEGLRTPDSGQVTVLGLDVIHKAREVKSRVGIQLQTTALYPRLNVREVLNLFATFYTGPKRSTDEPERAGLFFFRCDIRDIGKCRRDGRTSNARNKSAN